MNRPSAADRATLAITLMIVAAGVWIFFAGPLEVMPYHYGPDGQADAWAGREAIGLGIAVMGLLAGLFAGGMGVAARRAEFHPGDIREPGAGSAGSARGAERPTSPGSPGRSRKDSAGSAGRAQGAE